jgi:hypothetical protein
MFLASINVHAWCECWYLEDRYEVGIFGNGWNCCSVHAGRERSERENLPSHTLVTNIYTCALDTSNPFTKMPLTNYFSNSLIKSGFYLSIEVSN